MPDEELWATFFDPELIPDRLSLSRSALHHGIPNVVEFGCGYGTFTIPAAQRTAGLVHALDIDPDMVALTSAKAAHAGLQNVRATVRDFVRSGTGLADHSVLYAMLFNILHAENPLQLRREAYRVVAPRGILGIMHWNYDPTTPRGPSMHIRPKPDQCRHWAEHAGFQMLSQKIIDLPPHHYGIVMHKPVAE